MPDRVACPPAGLPGDAHIQFVPAALCWSEELLSQQSESPVGARKRGAGLGEATTEEDVKTQTDAGTYCEQRCLRDTLSLAACHHVTDFLAPGGPWGAPVTGLDRSSDGRMQRREEGLRLHPVTDPKHQSARVGVCVCVCQTWHQANCHASCARSPLTARPTATDQDTRTLLVLLVEVTLKSQQL